MSLEKRHFPEIIVCKQVSLKKQGVEHAQIRFELAAPP